MTRTVACSFCAAWTVFAAGGCSHMSFSFGPCSSAVAKETLTLSAEDVSTLRVETHNGGITITGQDEGDRQFLVHVTKKGTAWTEDGAQECLDAIELVTVRDGDAQTLGWRWLTPRRFGWNASVKFNIEAPQSAAVTAAVHNGKITVIDVSGDCDLTTHNGTVRLDSTSRHVRVETHNGGIRIAAPPETIHATSHNGTIHAALGGEHNVTGSIETHNGGITIVMNDSASANFDCGTHNGGIHADLELSDISSTRNSLRGRFGHANGTLRVRTHNGVISLKNSP